MGNGQSRTNPVRILLVVGVIVAGWLAYSYWMNPSRVVQRMDDGAEKERGEPIGGRIIAVNQMKNSRDIVYALDTVWKLQYKNGETEERHTYDHALYPSPERCSGLNQCDFMGGSEPEPWAGTFNGADATNAFSLRVLHSTAKFSVADPTSASGVEIKVDCEGHLDVPEGRSSFAVRVPMQCSVGPSQLSPFLTFDAASDSWILTPNSGTPISLNRTARTPSMN